MEPSPDPKRLAVEETRVLLLQTGVDLLMSDSVAGNFDIKVSDVVAKVGRTTGSAYQIWRNQEHYRRELALFVAESVEYANPTAIAGLIGPELAGAETVVDVITLVGSAYFDYFVDRPEFATFLRLGSMTRPDPEIAEAVLGGYQHLEKTLGTYLQAALSVEGPWSFRDGASMEHASRTVTALTEGFALRARFARNGDPALVPDRLESLRTDYIASLIALTRHMTTATAGV